MIVITGGSGFIGSHLAAHLVDEGHKVRIIDIAPPQLGAQGEFVRASVLDPLRLSRLFEGADGVAHLAALIDVQASIADPYSDFEVNARGTLLVLEAARRAGVKKVAYASSAAVYGNPARLPVSESHLASPLSPYGQSKLTGERYVLAYNSLFGMENTALRPFNVYGRGQNPLSPYSGVITKFAKAIEEGNQPLIYGDGEQTRDFVHVDDVAAAFAAALDSKGCASPMNIGSGKETAILDLLEKMGSLAGKSPMPRFLAQREGEIKRSVADISLAKKRLGFCPKIALEQGLKEIVSG